MVSGLEMTGGFVFKSSRLKYCKAMLALINTLKLNHKSNNGGLSSSAFLCISIDDT